MESIAAWASQTKVPLVVDPVMVSTKGGSLLSPDARDAFLNQLLPKALLITPNLDEVREIVGLTVKDLEQMEIAARLIAQYGCKGVLIKGGHLSNEPTDVLWWDGHIERFPGTRIVSQHTHGTGCTHSAAITAELAKGSSMADAVRLAKSYVTQAIINGPGL